MIYPKIEDCISRAEQNKYVLATMVAKRAKDLVTRNAGQTASGKEKQIFTVGSPIIPTFTIIKNGKPIKVGYKFIPENISLNINFFLNLEFA